MHFSGFLKPSQFPSALFHIPSKSAFLNSNIFLSLSLFLTLICISNPLRDYHHHSLSVSPNVFSTPGSHPAKGCRIVSDLTGCLIYCVRKLHASSIFRSMAPSLELLLWFPNDMKFPQDYSTCLIDRAVFPLAPLLLHCV